MTQNQNKPRYGLRRRWQALPIYIKLLIPIIVGLALTVAIITARVQSPIDALAQNAVRESFQREIEILQERLVTSLQDYSTTLNNVTASPDLKTYVELADTTDPAQLKRTQG